MKWLNEFFLRFLGFFTWNEIRDTLRRQRFDESYCYISELPVTE